MKKKRKKKKKPLIKSRSNSDTNRRSSRLIYCCYVSVNAPSHTQELDRGLAKTFYTENPRRNGESLHHHLHLLNLTSPHPHPLILPREPYRSPHFGPTRRLVPQVFPLNLLPVPPNPRIRARFQSR